MHCMDRVAPQVVVSYSRRTTKDTKAHKGNPQNPKPSWYFLPLVVVALLDRAQTDLDLNQRKLSFLRLSRYTRAMRLKRPKALSKAANSRRNSERSPGTRRLKELASFLDVPLIGDAKLDLTGVASLQSAGPEDLVFVEDAKHLNLAMASNAGAVLAGEFARNGTHAKPVLIAPQPRLAFARAAAWLAGEDGSRTSVHPTAVVHRKASIAASVSIEERAVIRENVQIAEGTRISAGCVIGPDVIIGRDCRMYPNVTIYPGTELGDRVVVHAGAVLGSDGFGYVRDAKTGRYEKFPQIGRLVIEDDVEVGANSTVDRGALDVTRIRRGTKIDNLVHIGHNVDIGEDVVIAAQTGVSGSSVLENDVIVGGQVGIADHVRIEKGAILGAQSGIPSKKVIRGKGVVFWGTPARPIREYLKELAALARFARESRSKTRRKADDRRPTTDD